MISQGQRGEDQQGFEEIRTTQDVHTLEVATLKEHTFYPVDMECMQRSVMY